jgi:hypothetical protein
LPSERYPTLVAAWVEIKTISQMDTSKKLDSPLHHSGQSRSEMLVGAVNGLDAKPKGINILSAAALRRQSAYCRPTARITSRTALMQMRTFRVSTSQTTTLPETSRTLDEVAARVVPQADFNSLPPSDDSDP